MKYKTVLADPPWNETGGGRIKRGANKYYSLMKTEEIIRIMKKQIDEWCEDECHLYLWVTNNFLKDGLQVIDELGFKYITCITWNKDRISLGQYYRGITEHCLFARRGVLPYKIKDGKRQQGVTGFFEKKTIHSKKPELMFKMIEKVSYGPYLELFARTKRSGWTAWGDEIK